MSLKRCLSLNKSSNALKKAQFNFKDILNNTSRYAESIHRRKEPRLLSDVDFILENRNKETDLAKKINTLKHERTQVGEAMKKAKGNISEEIKKKSMLLKQQLKDLENEQDSLEKIMHAKIEGLPNLLDQTVPRNDDVGDVVKFINCASEEEATSRQPASLFDHKSIAEELKIVDFSTASRVSGSSWYYLIGDGALLEYALVLYCLSQALKLGYIMVSPPSILKSEVIQACGFKPNDQNDEKQIYDLTNDNLSLIGTAEIPLGALHSSSIFPVSQIYPIKYVGVSRAFRAEAGARGTDTKGLYRVHEFTKVELFHFTTPEKASGELEEIKDFQINLIESLGLTAKMINMPTSDLGAPAMKKYDCEAWMPGRQSWGEITSASNCGDYQSRRLGIRSELTDENGRLKYLSTLNGTGVAVPRLIATILEQNYDPKTKSVLIPQVLRPYMNNRERIFRN